MRAYCDFYESSPPDEGVLRMVRTLITDPSQGAVFIARQDGKAIGFATLDWKWSMLNGARVGYLEDLFVDPGGQGTAARRRVDPDLRRSVPRAGHGGDGVADRARQPPSPDRSTTGPGLSPDTYVEYYLEL